MPMETVLRRWTVVTWLVSGVDDAETIVRAVEPHGADAIALQSIRERTVEEVAAALGVTHVWALSHYRRSRLLPGSAVGLAVLSPHRITSSDSVVGNDHRSTWSTKRRIAQRAAVERGDHSAVRINHAVGPSTLLTAPDGGMPIVVIRPEQVGVDTLRAVELPNGASLVDQAIDRPRPNAPQLLAVTFEMPWVQGDFPVA